MIGRKKKWQIGSVKSFNEEIYNLLKSKNTIMCKHRIGGELGHDYLSPLLESRLKTALHSLLQRGKNGITIVRKDVCRVHNFKHNHFKYSEKGGEYVLRKNKKYEEERPKDKIKLLNRTYLLNNIKNSDNFCVHTVVKDFYGKYSKLYYTKVYKNLNRLESLDNKIRKTGKKYCDVSNVRHIHYSMSSKKIINNKLSIRNEELNSVNLHNFLIKNKINEPFCLHEIILKFLKEKPNPNSRNYSAISSLIDSLKRRKILTLENINYFCKYSNRKHYSYKLLAKIKINTDESKIKTNDDVQIKTSVSYVEHDSKIELSKEILNSDMKNETKRTLMKDIWHICSEEKK